MSQVSSPINSCIRKIDYSNSILDRIQNLSCNKFLCCWIVHKEKLITFKFRPSKNIRLIQINALWSSLCSIYLFPSIRNTLTRLCRNLYLMKFHFIIATNIFTWYVINEHQNCLMILYIKLIYIDLYLRLTI